MKLILLSAPAAVLLLSACVAPAPTAPAANAAKPTTTANADEIICTNEYTLGARLPERVCETRAQRAAEKMNAVGGGAGLSSHGPATGVDNN